MLARKLVIGMVALACSRPCLAAPSSWEDLVRKGDEALLHKDYPNAKLHWQQAKIESTRFGRDDVRRFYIISKLIQLAYASGKLQDAKPLYEQSLSFTALVKGSNSGDYIESLLQYAKLLERLGDMDEAAEVYIRARGLLNRSACEEQRQLVLVERCREGFKRVIAISKAYAEMDQDKKEQLPESTLIPHSATEAKGSYITEIYTESVGRLPPDIKKLFSDHTQLSRLLHLHGAALIVLDNKLVFMSHLDSNQYHWKTACKVRVSEDPRKGHPYYSIEQIEAPGADGNRYRITGELVGSRN